MRYLTNILMLSLVGYAYCMLHLQLPADEITNSNDLRKQLEESVDNTSHHLFAQTNVPKIVEKIRSVDLFKAKIANRLASSNVVAHFPDMKTKIMTIAVEKFKTCEASPRSSTEAHDIIGHSCLGSVTARMMGLINAFEKNPTKSMF